ncbi:hypothetical protein SeLEV6574_g02186 [Synchytrium endobioticum]|uniref:Uncharacterized protein n=1 Tax=Synchytrium endobioticum TaxID=286115 RepID=A0A507D9I7_9FUNG|nr:hypothetical protein SeLEV6574_g02186 [Synchytrium endobioticum]
MKYSLRNVSLNLINSRVQRLISPPTILPQFVKYDHIPGFEADASKFAHPLVSNSIRLGIKHIAWSHIYSDTIIAVDENHFDRKKKRHSLKKGMIAEIDMDGHGLISKQPVHNGSNRVGARGTSSRSSTARNSHTFRTRAPAAPLSTIASPKMIALTHQLPVIRIPVNSVRLYKSDPLTEPATDSGGFIKVSVSPTRDFAVVAGTDRILRVIVGMFACELARPKLGHDYMSLAMEYLGLQVPVFCKLFGSSVPSPSSGSRGCRRAASQDSIKKYGRVLVAHCAGVYRDAMAALPIVTRQIRLP